MNMPIIGVTAARGRPGNAVAVGREYLAIAVLGAGVLPLMISLYEEAAKAPLTGSSRKSTDCS